MVNDTKFSVLIPVYNVEKYLRECVDSVLCQSYKNFEIILVDDGSTDSSGRMCDEYARENENIKVIHQTNKGQYLARKEAVNYAVGDYCIYLDSDDFWEPCLLEKVNETISKFDCDIVMFSMRDYINGKFGDKKILFENNSIFAGQSKLVLYEKLIETNDLNNLVLKAFKNEICERKSAKYGFEGICYGEDGFESACLIKNAERIIYIDECLYNYRKGSGVTNHISADRIEKLLNTKIQLESLLLKTGLDLSESINKRNIIFMRHSVKCIIYGYMHSPQILKQTMKKVIKNEYYQEMKKYAYPKLSFFEKLVLNVVEEEKYYFVHILALVLKIRKIILKTFK